MTVSDLILELQKMPGDLKLVIQGDNFSFNWPKFQTDKVEGVIEPTNLNGVRGILVLP